jgi:tRNA C32,U32 (ribose-2'-O)-methylase TrmJ
MKEDDTIKKQEEYETKERIFAEAIFSESFLQLLDKTTEELQEKDTLKNAELHKQMMNEVAQAIERLKMEYIDTRVLTMVFAKSLIATTIGSAHIEIRWK